MEAAILLLCCLLMHGIQDDLLHGNKLAMAGESTVDLKKENGRLRSTEHWAQRENMPSV